MAFIGSLITTVKANTSVFGKKLRKAAKDTRKLRRELRSLAVKGGKSFIKLGKIIGVTALVIGVAVVKMASDFEEAQQKFDVVFDAVRNKALSMRNELVKSFGLSKTAATELLSATGDLLTGFGFTDAAALKLSGRVQKLAVDLASFSNLQGGSARASEILTKALLGERDSLVSLGVKILEADLQQRLLIKGHQDLEGVALRAAKAEATFELILEQTTKAQGDFSRSSGSVANQTKVLIARTNDYATALGQKLLPFVKVAQKRFLDLTDRFDDYIKLNDKLVDQKIDKIFLEIARAVGQVGDAIELVKSKWEKFSGTFRLGAGIVLKPIGALLDTVKAGITLENIGGAKRSFISRLSDELIELAEKDFVNAEVSANKFKLKLNELAAVSFAEKFIDDTKKATEEINKMNEALKKQQIEAKKVAEEFKKRFEIAKKEAELRKKLEAEKKKVIAAAEEIFRETRTPLEKIEAEVKRIMELFKKGGFKGIEGAFERKIEELKKQKEEILKALQKEKDSEIVAAKFGLKKKDKIEDELKKKEGGFRRVDVRNINIKGLQKIDSLDKKQLNEQKKANELLNEIKNKVGNQGGAVAV